MVKAAFLDRDGVINHDPGDYTMCLEDFQVLPDVYEALGVLQQKGYLLIMITNQGGIAKGLYGHDEVQRIHDWFLGECEKHGVTWTDIYYAPSHPDFGESLFRKPNSMMVERGLAKHNVDAGASILIGDKQRDLDSGAVVGVKGILLEKNGSLLEAVQNLA